MQIRQMENDISQGRSYPLGATLYSDGINFSVFSKNAEFIELLLFDGPEDEKPASVIKLDPVNHRSFYYWHVFIKGLKAGQLYGYRVHGPYEIEEGYRFDGGKLLVDPYAKAVVTPEKFSRDAAKVTGDNCASAMKSAVIPEGGYNWEGDEPLNIPYSKSIIYELHVKGFTADQSSGLPEEKRGTYSGLIEKIPYLKSLGITAIELLPVAQFDPQDAQDGLPNYWGYTPVNFFAVHDGYGSVKDPIGLINEFRDMVKAMHQAGIEVILDVVFNHSAEGGHDGPTYCFKGFENKAYYMLNHGRNEYLDYTGCGNTMNANHSIVRRIVRDALRYWVSEMHVDGFRFDLASVLTRDETGEPLENPPLIWEIESDPVLARTKIIAEAWDAAGLYQVGSFIGDKWAEWNGRYRDDIRQFVKGDKALVSVLASRILGSPDIYPDPEREPNRSIHLITCHDGFTMNDLVTYDTKHNEANLESNMDGSNQNFSWNCGTEGPTNEAKINRFREKQIKNYFTILFCSQGTPMFLMGDEVRRTQQGNNNAYCQDNALNWFDWNLVEINHGLFRFVKGLINLTQGLEIFKLENILITSEIVDEPHLIWHGIKVERPDWNDWSNSLAFSLHHPTEDEHFYVAMNAYHESLEFNIPDPVEGKSWHLIVDTHLPSPLDFTKPSKSIPIKGKKYVVHGRTNVVLMTI